MSYHNVRLPETFSAGSLFGPGFRTKIIELDSLAEQRVQRGPVSGRRSYSLERGIDSIEALRTLYEFFLARQGSLNTFRLKDWLDYASTPSGTTYLDDDVAPAYDDQDLVLISGLDYQLVKRYTSGSQTIVRTITKPVAGTVLVGDGTGALGSGWSVNTETGVVTFSVSPTGQATAGFEFDVPVRFGEETGDNLLIAIQAVGSGSLPEIRCIEDVEPVVVSQDFPFGGAYNHGDISANVNMSELNGRVQVFEPSTTGKKAILPAKTSLPLGGPYFFIWNAGSQTLTIRDGVAASDITTITAGTGKAVWLGIDSGGTRTWLVA